MAVVGLVLLVACANVANLLLARASSRQWEAVRMSMGAVRLRLIRQLLVESTLLSGVGTILGTGSARWATPLLLRMVSTGSAMLPLSVAPDAKGLGFPVLIAILTVVLLGMAPAFCAARVEVVRSLKRRARDHCREVTQPAARANRRTSCSLVGPFRRRKIVPAQSC